MADLHAIKVLDPQLTQNPQIVTRFVNEARAAAKLRHRNLVRVHNVERMPNDGPWFMVLDYLEGGTLARFMAASGGPVPPRIILHVLAQVVNCVQHVHDHKIVHRDLKPDNIFLIQQGDDPRFPIVLDLGVAQLSEDLASGPATKTGTVIGTPIYMAPEQLRGERVTPAADIFALGVIAYEMSTGGYFPYQYNESRSGYFELPATELYYRQRSGPPFDPRRRNPGLGDAWVEALRTALAADPGARPMSARAFALMLAEAVRASPDGADGMSIVHQVARELIQNRHSDNDLQRSGPAAVLARDAGADPSPEQTTQAELVSTLAGAASQSLEGSGGRRRRWGLVAAAGLAALVAAGATAYAVTQLLAPLDPSGRGTPGHALETHGGHRGASAAVTGAPPAVSNAAHPDAPAVSSEPRATAGRPDAVAPAPKTPPVAIPPADGAHSAAPPATAPPAEVARPTAPSPQRTPPAASSPATPAPGEPRTPQVGTPMPSNPPRPSITTASAAGQAAAPSVIKKTGELAIIVKPWAMIWLNGKSLGQTPFRENIATGKYRLRIANDDVGKDETLLVTVNPDQNTTVQRNW